ncbi:hypothetical protein [Candidatus Williamhamiltonella defendens]|uniref:hypothetical protein n=1 Tax=Candidatus Williamhamiltonella defendens TaxID=138072 RepID=UPI00130DBA3B|nr:hypothetical protein [Candidatus Hamiltonella defensa]
MYFLFYFGVFSCTKIKRNDATTISKIKITVAKPVSKQILEELSKKLDKLINGLFRESGYFYTLISLQKINSGKKVYIDKIYNQDTAIGFLKKF